MVVGLTGGIGSGKSTVLNFFKELGVQVFIADDEAKKLMRTNKKLRKEIIALFGKEAYVNNELNRKYIASVVFNEKEKLKALNNIVHPAVRKEFVKFKNTHKSEIVIYEAAILFESGNDENCDFIVTVIAETEEKIRRLLKRDLSTRAEIESRMKNQVDDEFKIKRSHFIIQNSDLKSAKIQVQTVFKMLSTLYKKCNIS